MARQVRIEYPGSSYHLMVRGNYGQPVFADGADLLLWLQTLEEACEKTGWRIHAYVLMGNHFHLLVETPEPNLVTGMNWLPRPNASASARPSGWVGWQNGSGWATNRQFPKRMGWWPTAIASN